MIKIIVIEQPVACHIFVLKGVKLLQHLVDMPLDAIRQEIELVRDRGEVYSIDYFDQNGRKKGWKDGKD